MVDRFCFVIILLAAALSFADNYPRSGALGAAGAILPESGVLHGSNPAGLSIFENHVFYLSFNRPYAGIGDPMGAGAFGYGHHFRNLDIGIDLEYFQSKMTNRADFGLTLSRRFGNISTGVRFRGLYNSFRKDNFHYSEGDDPIDPVFDERYGLMNITGDAGIIYRLSDRASVGILAVNIVDPNMALSNIGTSKTGVDIKLGASFVLGRSGTIYAQSGYSTGAADGSQIGFGAGFESDIIHPNLVLRTGFTDTELSLGLGFRLPTGLPLRLDYAFGYPLSDLGRVATNHGFALVGEIEPTVKIPDLAIEMELDRDKYPIGDTAVGIVRIRNKYLRANDVGVSVVRRIAREGEDKILAETIFPRIEADGSVDWEVALPLDSPGEWDLVARVDPEGAIAEKNENNNLAEDIFAVHSLPGVGVFATPDVLKVESVDYVYQDESIVPAVFFETGSADFDPAYSPLLDLLTDRLAENPDAKFSIFGYFDPVRRKGAKNLPGGALQMLWRK